MITIRNGTSNYSIRGFSEEDYSLSANISRNNLILSQGSTSNIVINGEINATSSTVTSYEDRYDFTVTRSGRFFDRYVPNIYIENTGIATLESNGVTISKSSGTGTTNLVLDAGTFIKKYPLSFASHGNTNVQYSFVSYVNGTKQQLNNTAITSLFTPTGTPDLRWFIGTSTTPNPNFVLKDITNLSSLMVQSSYAQNQMYQGYHSRQRWLPITPRHCINVNHYQTGPASTGNPYGWVVGTVIYFRKNDGTLISRTVDASYGNYSLDHAVVRLSQDLPAEIEPFDIADVSVMYNPASYMVNFTQENSVAVSAQSNAAPSNVTTYVSKSPWDNIVERYQVNNQNYTNYQQYGGDSGSPYFWIVNNKLVLYSLTWTPSLTKSLLQGYIDDLGNSGGYTPTYVHN